MSATGLHVFDQSTHEANVWLKELENKLHTDDRHLAMAALRASLHALRDRLGSDSAVHLGAQLPTLIRGIYYEGWRIAGAPSKERHKSDFLDHVRAELRGHSELYPERAVRATFELLWDKIDPGEVAKIIEVLPAELRDLWPRLARAD